MKIFILLLIFIFSFAGVGISAEVWKPVFGIKDADLREVAVDAESPGIIYASSERTLYRTDDYGKTWITVFYARGDDNKINFIRPFNKGLFICTEKGLFHSPNGLFNWKRVFRGMGEEEKRVMHTAFSEDGRIYLGTKAGLFISSDNAATWHKDSGAAGNLSLKWIAFLEDEILLAAETGVYKGFYSKWERIFAVSTEETEYDTDSTDESFNAVKSINSILVYEENIFLATDSGIYISKDKGRTWERFDSKGLLSQKVTRVLFKDDFYAATDKGVFIFNDKNDTWESSYKGLSTGRIDSMALDNNGIIWIATNKGLYVKTVAKSGFGFLEEERDMLRRFSREPSAREVQEMAVSYAEVYPEKIERWRRRASLKALLPELSLDYDKTISYDSGADRYYVGPYDWGATLKWDLGEIIWNDDQTSIDVRSKLMVQLRDDILDEITRTYFERRRLQIEMYVLPPKDPKQKLEKELRVQELTADLDALTGGRFSEKLK